jgi:hypothetical protein
MQESVAFGSTRLSEHWETSLQLQAHARWAHISKAPKSCLERRVSECSTIQERQRIYCSSYHKSPSFRSSCSQKRFAKPRPAEGPRRHRHTRRIAHHGSLHLLYEDKTPACSRVMRASPPKSPPEGERLAGVTYGRRCSSCSASWVRPADCIAAVAIGTLPSPVCGENWTSSSLR